MLPRPLWCCWDPHILVLLKPFWNISLLLRPSDSGVMRPPDSGASETPRFSGAAETSSLSCWCCWDSHILVLLRHQHSGVAETPTFWCCWDTHILVLLRPPVPYSGATETPRFWCCWDPQFHILVLLSPPDSNAAETPQILVLQRPPLSDAAETPNSPCRWDPFGKFGAAETPTSLCCWDPLAYMLLRPLTFFWGLFIIPL